ncbi:MAG: MFS transporter [Hymenobacter sp.]
MTPIVRFKLSLMMFLEFFIWGAWFVTLGTYLLQNLHTSGLDVGAAFLTQSIGAIIAPFIIGLIADRFFSAQKILGVLHLIGALLLWWAAGASDFGSFYPSILLYMVVYMPTLALVNSISFRQMKNPQKEFASVRVLGTLGWIVAGLTIGWLNWEQRGGAGPHLSRWRPARRPFWASSASRCRLLPREARRPRGSLATCWAWGPSACSRTART